MSNIASFQDKIAGMSVSFTDQQAGARAITCKNVTAIKNSVQASVLPLRLLLPWAAGSGMSATMSEPATDGAALTDATITWQFQDVMLWRPIAFGEGLGDAFYDLREYASAYFTAALALDFSSISDRMTIESIDLAVSDFINFPEGSTNIYIGVLASWTVREDDP